MVSRVYRGDIGTRMQSFRLDLANLLFERMSTFRSDTLAILMY